jgi:hypothetical protein
MFNLIHNLPSDFCRPFTRSPTGTVTFLVNNEPYADSQLETGLFTGLAPYEAPLRYSKELKDLVTNCLRYEQMDRPDIGELLRAVREGVDGVRVNKAPGPLRVMRDGGVGRWRAGKRRRGDGE